MDNNKKERLMISIITVSSLGNIAECLVAGWELWILPVIVIGVIGIWWLHIVQRNDMITRTNVYFIFAAFLVFFHGIHDVSYFDVSIVTIILMATFMITDRISLLNLILIEYIVIMAYQFFMLYMKEGTDITPVVAIRTVLHIGVVVCMYSLGRVLANSRIAANVKLDKWREAVEENDHDMEDFLSNISHELRTPVNVISGMTTLMQKDNDSKELSSIQDAGIRLAHQIEDIQDYTEIKRGELHLEEENYMCLSLVNDVVALYRASSRKNDIELIVDLDPTTPAMLKGDIKKLHKLFRHLLENSIKFTMRGGIYIKVMSVPRDYGVNLIIEVTDTGIGMTRADMSRISKGMYQANKKRNRSTGGIGIGLPIVYGFVHKMGGFVNISSTKGSGTTVRLSIPQQIVDQSATLTIKEESKEDLVFYTKPEKYRVPEVREYYRQMMSNLAEGLRAKLYQAGEREELRRLTQELNVSHIFTGQEEYESDRELLDELAHNGYRIVVAVKEEFGAPIGSGVSVIPKPLYAFPVVRLLNGESESEGFEVEGTGKIKFTGASALIVDDEPMNLVVASGLLKEYKMFSDTAESGKEAIKKFEEGEYDVVFMDHMMPGMDGVEAMKAIRQVAEVSGKKPVIIALTANALSGAREMFLNEGFDGFIAKPIDIAEFERVLKRVLPEDLIHNEGRDN